MTPELSIRLLDWLLKRQKLVHQLSLSEIDKRNAQRLDGFLAWLFLRPKLSLPKVVDKGKVLYEATDLRID
ncbi:MAG: hypothetical protein AAF609_23930 [Cyanobacteria bacterium P01_C01_bin.120]